MNSRNHIRFAAALLCSASLLATGCSSANSDSSTSEESASETTKQETNLDGFSIAVESDILGMADTGNKTSLKETLIKTSVLEISICTTTMKTASASNTTPKTNRIPIPISRISVWKWNLSSTREKPF